MAKILDGPVIVVRGMPADDSKESFANEMEDYLRQVAAAVPGTKVNSEKLSMSFLPGSSGEDRGEKIEIVAVGVFQEVDPNRRGTLSLKLCKMVREFYFPNSTVECRLVA
ncbi:MAG: hypothetical protein PHP03_02515 [Candidatus Pacebacteria bacterium]|nr:hypothetical protein [Candidatus Paceibacterota bacterium]